jgi:LssY-like putative type I secretion system component LssY
MTGESSARFGDWPAAERACQMSHAQCLTPSLYVLLFLLVNSLWAQELPAGLIDVTLESDSSTKIRLEPTISSAYYEATETKSLPVVRGNVPELGKMIHTLPPRVLNGEGRQGDMLNLIFLAKEGDLQEAFAHAGWLKADHSKLRIIWRLFWQRTRYTKLPMAKLYVFGRGQDYSYVLPDPKAIVARRHHIRIWKTDHMVDGIPLWVGAATHDVSIHLVKHKFRLSHRIDPNVDAERDFVAANLNETQHITREQYVHSADPVFHAQTATGQTYYSDSRLLFLQLYKGVASTAGETEVAASLR